MWMKDSDHGVDRSRATETMAAQGYCLFSVPIELKQKLREAVFCTIAKDQGSLDVHFEAISQQVMALPDDQFRSDFAKPNRFFAPNLAPDLMRFAQDCAERVGAREGEISLVSPAEVDANSQLTPSCLDAFWRCVRPGREDVGRPHADVQFWELARGTSSEPHLSTAYDRRIKVWIPLAGCDRSNSLKVVEGSHLEAVPFKSVMTQNGLRPDIDQPWLDQKEFISPINHYDHECIIFDDRLVHMGPKNNSNRIRISCEFTILVKDF